MVVFVTDFDDVLLQEQAEYARDCLLQRLRVKQPLGPHGDLSDDVS